MTDVNNQYDFFKNVNIDANGNLGVVVSGGGPGGLPALTTDHIWVGNASNVAVEVNKNTLGGDSLYTADGTIGSNRIATLTDTLTFTGGNVKMDDDSRLYFGATNDLEIYHDSALGSSFIEDTGSGNLILLSNGPDGIILGKGSIPAYERVLRALPDAGVELYYDANLKLETVIGGVDITGDITLTGNVDGRDVATDGSKLDTIETGAEVNPILTKGLTLEEPTAADDITIFRTDVDITVQEVIAVSTGTTPNTTYQLKHSPDRNAAGNNLTTSASTTSTTTGDVATLSDATIPANSFVWLEVSAATGTGVYLSLDIRYTED